VAGAAGDVVALLPEAQQRLVHLDRGRR
jgi:hypothetical protein